MNDPSKYVQKSVANHINDITKEDKELVFQWLQQLRDKQHPVNPWIIKHGLRTVIKNGTLPKDFCFEYFKQKRVCFKNKAYAFLSFKYSNNKRIFPTFHFFNERSIALFR